MRSRRWPHRLPSLSVPLIPLHDSDTPAAGFSLTHSGVTVLRVQQMRSANSLCDSTGVLRTRTPASLSLLPSTPSTPRECGLTPSLPRLSLRLLLSLSLARNDMKTMQPRHGRQDEERMGTEVPLVCRCLALSC